MNRDTQRRLRMSNGKVRGKPEECGGLEAKGKESFKKEQVTDPSCAHWYTI